MRILLSTYGSRGDVEPLAALGKALETLGAEAIVSAPGDQEFVDLLSRADVELAPAFMPVRQWIDDAKKGPRDISAFARKMIGPQFEAIGLAAAGCDAIVATGLLPSAAAAQCVAEKLGLPYFHVSFCPKFLPSHHHEPIAYPGHPLPPDVTDARALWALNAEVLHAIFGEPVNTHRAGLGLPAVANVRDHVFTDRPWLASDPVLWPWAPTDLCDAVQTGAWVLADDRPLPDELEGFLENGAPPVYFGLGSIAVEKAKEIADVAIKAIRAQGRRAVLARGWAGMVLTDHADDCFLIGEVNQQALFRRCAAVVHHGGAGTATTAAMAGAPQVIVPQLADQPYWGDRVAALGVGAKHDGPAPTFESLSEALEAALAPAAAARAADAAARMRPDGATVAAKMLVEAVG